MDEISDVPNRTSSTEISVSGLGEWLQSEPGAAVASIETHLVRELLGNLFGYHIVQIGDLSLPSFLEHSRISHRIRINSMPLTCAEAALCARPEALPLETGSIDVVVMPHALEFAANPHDVLREAERILIGEGHVVVIGFNPWSLFGLWQRTIGWRGALPWAGRFLSMTRLQDWLRLLGFEIESVVRASFRPPLVTPHWHRRVEFLERLGGHFWPLFGNVYVVLARKRVIMVTRVRERWSARRRLATSSVVEPSARNTGLGGSANLPPQ
jgi:SAM-dependent methyltransferase